MREIPKEERKKFRKVLLDVPLDIAIDIKAESVRRNIKYYNYLIDCLVTGHRILSAERQRTLNSEKKLQEAI
jgi:hypothetical protein